MLYLGIDQHRKQLTVSLGDEEGRVLIARQVSTQWDRVRKFFAEVQELSQPAGEKSKTQQEARALPPRKP
jgi:hypothetical protein